MNYCISGILQAYRMQIDGQLVREYSACGRARGNESREHRTSQSRSMPCISSRVPAPYRVPVPTHTWYHSRVNMGYRTVRSFISWTSSLMTAGYSRSQRKAPLSPGRNVDHNDGTWRAEEALSNILPTSAKKINHGQNHVDSLCSLTSL